MRIRLIGLPTDSHSSFLRGAAAGPAAIRAALASDHGNSASESGLELGADIVVEDMSDLPLAENGDDSTPIVAALAERHGPLNVLHFDAHPDLYFPGDPRSHASPFAPGVSHHEPGGPSVREFLRVLHRVRSPIVGTDIVELNPSRDVNGVTATLAAKLVRELAALTAKAPV
jgi:arginase family enzyme